MTDKAFLEHGGLKGNNRRPSLRQTYHNHHHTGILTHPSTMPSSTIAMGTLFTIAGGEPITVLARSSRIKMRAATSIQPRAHTAASIWPKTMPPGFMVSSSYIHTSWFTNFHGLERKTSTVSQAVGCLALPLFRGQ